MQELCMFYAVAYFQWKQTCERELRALSKDSTLLQSTRNRRVPKLMRVTKKMYAEFSKAYPEECKNFAGVTQSLIPLMENYFQIRFMIFRKCRIPNKSGELKCVLNWSLKCI